jgi:hypothetical protein
MVNTLLFIHISTMVLTSIMRFRSSYTLSMMNPGRMQYAEIYCAVSQICIENVLPKFVELILKTLQQS